MCSRALAFLILALSLSMQGCFVTTTNISNDPRYPTDYVVGGVYRLKQPLYALKSGLTIFGTYSHLSLSTTDANQGGHLPNRVEDYEQDRSRYNHIAGLAPIGTKLKVLEIILSHNPKIGHTIWIRGMLIDVPWANETSEMLRVSRRVPFPGMPYVDMPHVDPEILEFVAGPETHRNKSNR